MYQLKPSIVFNKTAHHSHAKNACSLYLLSIRGLKGGQCYKNVTPQRFCERLQRANHKQLCLSANHLRVRREMSTWGSFLHKNWPWLFKNKTLGELSEATEETTTMFEAAAPSLAASDPVYKCVTTEQLLQLVSKEELLTPKQYSVALEQLFRLAYSESVPYLTNSTSLFEFILRGKDENEAVVAPIRSSQEFQILICRVQDCLQDLDKSDVVTSLFGLTYLRVPESTGLYHSLCVRLLDATHTGYSLSDLNRLHLVMFKISCNNLMYYQTFFPKMNKWFELNKNLPVDKEGLKQLIYIFTQGKFKLSGHQSVTKRCINHLDRVVKDTDLIFDPEIAILLLEKIPNLNRDPSYSKQLDVITEAAMATVEQNLESLTPFDINSLSYFAFHCSIKVKKPASHERFLKLMQRNVVDQIVGRQLNASELCSLLTNNFSQLTHRQISVEERSEIKRKLHEILPQASFFSLIQTKLSQQLIKVYELEDILVSKIAENIENFDGMYAVSWQLKILTTEMLTQNPKLHAQVEQTLAQFYKTNPSALSPLFQLQALTYSMSRPDLMPASLQLVNKFAETCSHSFDPAQLMKSLNLLRRLVLYLVHNHKLDNTQLSNGNLYRLAILNVYISVLKMLGTIIQTMDESEVSVQKMISLLNLASQIKKDDPMLTEFSASMFESLVRKTTNKKEFLSLPSKQVESLLNPETASQVIELLLSDEAKLRVVNDNLWYLLRLVSRFETTETVDSSVQKLLTRFLMHDFEEMQCFDQVRLLSYCALYYNVPVDPGVMDGALKSFFNTQKLQEVDRLLTAVGPITRKSLQHRLYYLNMYASFKRPHLGIPWFHDHTHIAPSVAERNPGVGEDITAMFGGPEFVKSKVNISNGFIAWKMVLLNEERRPVLFRPDNFLYSQELGLDRVCISYVAFGEQAVKDPSLQPYIQLYFDVLARQVDKSLLVFDHEWMSLGCSSMEDKLDLVLSKIEDDQLQPHLTGRGRPLVDRQHGVHSFKKWALSY